MVAEYLLLVDPEGAGDVVEFVGIEHSASSVSGEDSVEGAPAPLPRGQFLEQG
jgi:hypothetical protein